MVVGHDNSVLRASQPSLLSGDLQTASRHEREGREAPPEVALLGSKPAFAEVLQVGRPNIPDRSAFLSRINRMLDNKQLTNFGPMALELENKIAEVAGARHCVATCNGTVGLELAIGALGMQGEVIVPSFTFIATTHALWRQNIRPVFCDVDPETHCLDPRRVREAITSATTGILGVSLWGDYSGEEELRSIADEHGIKLLLDSAHSFGCGRERAGCGIVSDAEVFSLHATKCIHAIEGGAIVTDDDALAKRLRLMVNFGFAGEDTVTYLGTNGKMCEATAAMGLTSIEAKDRIFEQNRMNYLAYMDGLSNVSGIKVRARSPQDRHNFHYVVCEIDSSTAGLTRDELIAALRLENVVARRYFFPGCHRMEPYASLFPNSKKELPVTEAVAGRVMVLPNGLSVSRENVARLTERISSIVYRAPEVRAALKNCKDPRLPSFMR